MPNSPRQFKPAGGKPARKAQRWDSRESASERGYDWTWHKLRNTFLAENPLCQHCEERGYINEATEVDHIIPINGKDDPLRLDPNNLQSLCHRCHVKKTHRDQRMPAQTAQPNRALHIIVGPPGSGKTYHVNQHKREGDTVFDYDTVAHALGAPLYECPACLVQPIEQLRESILNQVAGAAWIIYTDLPKAREAAFRHNGRLRIMETPEEVCIERLRMEQRPRLNERIEKVRAWWRGHRA